MTDLSQLIERVEAATEGSRELDYLVDVALGNPDHWKLKHQRGQCRKYTGSIDELRSFPIDALCVFASDIGADGLPMVTIVTDTSANPVVEYTGIAATLELAWCAAILKAKQAEARSPEQSGVRHD